MRTYSNAIMRPLPITEKEFWKKVRAKVKRGNFPLLTAVEAVRDEYDIAQVHIAALVTSIGFTGHYEMDGQSPWKMKGVKLVRDLIDKHIERTDDQSVRQKGAATDRSHSVC